ncbi:hypothetical protein BAOM_0937 [Peribacillus asahii]|uniref:Uncharacterized protein n=1 Tax=Peribacillus asahii TaxID=228899 RepID=A0A3T0KMQ9_9BACI|nr:hypothetical protein BAOM_0937 [Peribacillus asahii]
MRVTEGYSIFAEAAFLFRNLLSSSFISFSFLQAGTFRDP